MAATTSSALVGSPRFGFLEGLAPSYSLFNLPAARHINIAEAVGAA
jgi:hypothetical protein